MTRKSPDNAVVRQFILEHLSEHPRDIVSFTAAAFAISRVTAHRYVRRLVDDGLIEMRGATKATVYTPRALVDHDALIQIGPGMEEHIVWRENVLPHMTDVTENVVQICEYGVSEMVNNVLDHSGSSILILHVHRSSVEIEITIRDKGIGVFEKIRRDCQLDDPRHALLELSKGKLTTDPERHSGEGIFFTSRMFQFFGMASGQLFYSRSMEDGDEWLIETTEDLDPLEGTLVVLRIPSHVQYSIKDVFSRYENEEHSFVRTHVPVRLARYDNEQLVSRSQARRVLARFENFSEVILDFDGVTSIGQAFADEIFRVYRNAHRDVRIATARVSPDVQKVIDHVVHTSGVQPDLFETDSS